MGAISPVPFLTDEFREKIETQIVKPTIEGLKKDNLPYKGFVFIGLIKVGNEPKVIEYNVRMGDPETEVVIPRIKNDFLAILQAVDEGRLDEIDLELIHLLQLQLLPFLEDILKPMKKKKESQV